MAIQIPPPPSPNSDFNDFSWKDWFRILRNSIVEVGIGAWSSLNFAGSKLSDIVNRPHNDLQSIQGGSTGDHYHLSNAQYTGLVGGGDTTLHKHAYPYGAFQSTANQTVSTINTPTRVALDTTDFASGMNLVIGDGIHVTNAGLYNVQFSIQVTNADTQIHDLDIWIRKGASGGTASDVAGTASVCSVVGTHGGQPGYQFNAANFFIRFNAGDFIEFWWSTNSTQVTLQALPAITTPFTSPAAPSAVVTLTWVGS